MYPNAERNVMEEKRESVNGNTIEAVIKEVDEESEEEISKPISENNGLKEEEEEEPSSESEEEEKPSSESEDEIPIHSSSLDELETTLEANQRPSRMKRKSQCVDSDYEEEVVVNSRTRGRKRKMEKNNGNVQDKYEALMRAEEVKAKLDKRFPSFLKLLSPTHVSPQFLLPIPVDFSRQYMQEEDKRMILEDETGEEYEVKYLVNKTTLRGGWKIFSVGHNLLVGDVIVFHLVHSDKFKVYIVRARRSVMMDDSSLDAHPTETEDEIPITRCLRSKRKQVDCSSPDDELETPLEANQRPSRMKRKSQCVDSDTEEEVLANSRTRERKRQMEKNNGNVQDKYEALMRAEEIKAKLDKRFPSFLKLLSPTHVSPQFLLPIPVDFSRQYMQEEDKRMILEDETGEEYEVKYLVNKTTLRGGWKIFSVAHNLLVGDVIVFHLVHSDKFKVYIVRPRRSGEIDDSSLDAHPRDEHEINHEDSPIQNMDDGHHSSFIEFHSFKITVNGANLDSLLTQDVRKNYYELCLARNSYLHHHLKSGNDMLDAGIILETTKIANYIKGSKLSTSIDDLTKWDKKLEGFGVWGMDVGFLRARLKKLLNIATAMRDSPSFKEQEDVRIQRDSVDEKIQNLKSIMHELEREKMKLDSDMDALKVEVENFGFMFEEEANTPWSL